MFPDLTTGGLAAALADAGAEPVSRRAAGLARRFLVAADGQRVAVFPELLYESPSDVVWAAKPPVTAYCPPPAPPVIV
ncbi:hypothetical protein GCM10011578_006500 [Streptomyces fuscichromogenes]|uniref:Uncharacterized protein n=1 Tax=Streptomyces fuscichromogenes TaxID=1324013 RepID=A0A917UFY3_9ACTN|nr:hypothetical protein GCM10011578_006500 [Streptomyces fuscichromogenes]